MSFKPFHTFNQKDLALGSLSLSTTLLYSMISLGCSIGLGIIFSVSCPVLKIDRPRLMSGEFSTFLPFLLTKNLVFDSFYNHSISFKCYLYNLSADMMMLTSYIRSY